MRFSPYTILFMFINIKKFKNQGIIHVSIVTLFLRMPFLSDNCLEGLILLINEPNI